MDIHQEDDQIEGQMNIFEFLDEPVASPLVAVSKIFARAIKRMSLTEWKTFIFALCHIRWKETNKETVYIDKNDLAKVLGLEIDENHLSGDLRRALGNLPAHSLVEFAEEDADGFDNRVIISRVACTKRTGNHVIIEFVPSYMKLFQELDKEKNYITLWASDLFRMTSERSILFYEDLRLHCDTRKENTRIYSVKDFKTMFKIPKDGKGSYMKKNGHFDRPAFEKYVILPLCDDLAKCDMIHLAIHEDGMPYRKVKNSHGNVMGYEFSWTISNRPRIATATEVAEINEAIQKDGQVLKIAKDILKGDKKFKEKKPNFKQSGTDYESLDLYEK